jgi:2-keto-3-deoxy-L-rhamnonate aldolase RhmA
MRGVEAAHIMKSAGYDWLLIDLEGRPRSIESIFSIVAAALDVGIAPFVRVPIGELRLAVRCLDSGVFGVVMSQVDTVEDAQACIDALRFSPVGRRSAGKRYVQQTVRGGFEKNAMPVLGHAPMIIAAFETATGIANAEAITSLRGIDALLIGAPGLSGEMDVPGQFDHKRMIAAIRGAVTSSAKAGKPVGIGGVYQTEILKTYVGLGIKLILCGSDVGLLATAAQDRAKVVRASVS